MRCFGLFEQAERAGDQHNSAPVGQGGLISWPLPVPCSFQKADHRLFCEAPLSDRSGGIRSKAGPFSLVQPAMRSRGRAPGGHARVAGDASLSPEAAARRVSVGGLLGATRPADEVPRSALCNKPAGALCRGTSPAGETLAAAVEWQPSNGGCRIAGVDWVNREHARGAVGLAAVGLREGSVSRQKDWTTKRQNTLLRFTPRWKKRPVAVA